MTVISFTVHGVAQPAGSKKGFVNRSTGRVIITDDAKKSRPWKAQVSDAAAQAMLEPDTDSRVLVSRPLLDGPLLLELTVWINRPKGHYGSGKNALTVRAAAPWAPTVKPDLLKLARGIEDALTGIVYRDDAQIVTETLQKAYTTGSARTEIRIAAITAPGQHRPLTQETQAA